MSQELCKIYIPKTTAECRTLRDQREYVLHLTQVELAQRIGKYQSSVSIIERGVMPKLRDWPFWLKAYEIFEMDFVRLLKGSFEECASGGAKHVNGITAAVAGAAGGLPVAQGVDRTGAGAAATRDRAAGGNVAGPDLADRQRTDAAPRALASVAESAGAGGSRGAVLSLGSSGAPVGSDSASDCRDGAAPGHGVDNAAASAAGE